MVVPSIFIFHISRLLICSRQREIATAREILVSRLASSGIFCFGAASLSALANPRESERVILPLDTLYQFRFAPGYRRLFPLQASSVDSRESERKGSP